MGNGENGNADVKTAVGMQQLIGRHGVLVTLDHCLRLIVPSRLCRRRLDDPEEQQRPRLRVIQPKMKRQGKNERQRLADREASSSCSESSISAAEDRAGGKAQPADGVKGGDVRGVRLARRELQHQIRQADVQAGVGDPEHPGADQPPPLRRRGDGEEQQPGGHQQLADDHHAAGCPAGRPGGRAKG